MPQAAPMVLSTVVLTAAQSAGASAAASAFYALLVATVASAALKAGLDRDDDTAKGAKHNFSSKEAYLPLLYGTNRVGVNRVFIETSGKNRKYMNIVGTLGEGEIEGVQTIDGVPQIFLNDEIYTEYGGVHYAIFNGAPDQGLCDALSSQIGLGEDGEPRWNEYQRNTAYIYLRLEYNRDKPASIPKIEVVVNGLKIYNPITDIKEFTSNAALCAYDFITRSSLRGGLGYKAENINLTALNESINYCTDKGWTCNMPITENQHATDNLELILANFRGEVVVPSGRNIDILFRDLNYESPLVDIEKDDIIGTPELGQGSGFDRPNALRLNFLNPEKEYGLDDVVATDSSFIVADGEHIEHTDYAYGLSNPNIAMEMANYRLERARLNKTHNLVLKNEFWRLDPMDLVTVSYPDFGWDKKIFRITTIAPNKENTIAVGLEEEVDTLYNKTFDADTTITTGLDLVNPRGQVYSVTNVSVSEELYEYRGKTYTRLNVNFEKPDDSVYPWWDYAEILVKIGEEGEYHYKTRSEGNYFLDPVQEGVLYSIKIRSVSIHGEKQPLDEAYFIEKTIVGYNGAPANVQNFTVTVSGSVVMISADKVLSPNLIGYEIRLGDTSFESATFLGMLLDVPKARFTNLSPGMKTFWIAAKNDTPLYSPTPASVTVNIPFPTNFTYRDDWVWEFDEFNEPGTTSEFHSNTEHTLFDFGSGPIDALKCSHNPESSGNKNLLYKVSSTPIADLEMTTPGGSVANIDDIKYTLSAGLGDPDCVALWRFETGGASDGTFGNSLDAFDDALNAFDGTAGDPFLAPTIGTNFLTNYNSVEANTEYFKQGNSCASFVANSNQRLEISDSSLSSDFPFKSESSNGTITCCCWIRVWSADRIQYIWSKGDIDGERTLSMLVNENNRLEIHTGFNDGYGRQVLEVSNPIVAQNWYHVAFSFNNSNKSYRIRVWDDTNSTLLDDDKTGVLVNPVYIGSSPFVIGGRGDADASVGFSGHIDEVVIFKRILSTIEIDNIRSNNCVNTFKIPCKLADLVSNQNYTCSVYFENSMAGQTRISFAGGAAQLMGSFTNRAEITQSMPTYNEDSRHLEISVDFGESITIWDPQVESGVVATIFSDEADDAYGLTGRWTSPIYDLGSIKRARLFGDFIASFVEGAKTWLSCITENDTWERFAPAGTAWNEIVSFDSSISAILKYGDTDIDENTFENFHTLIADVDCRYFQVVITILDPEYGSNSFLKELNMTALTYE